MYFVLGFLLKSVNEDRHENMGLYWSREHFVLLSSFLLNDLAVQLLMSPPFFPLD